jgi:hypothetical protein
VLVTCDGEILDLVDPQEVIAKVMRKGIATKITFLVMFLTFKGLGADIKDSSTIFSGKISNTSFVIVVRLIHDPSLRLDSYPKATVGIQIHLVVENFSC